MSVVVVNMKKASLNENEIKHYYHSIKLKGFDEAGQLKLLNSKVLVIGVGGLGSAVLPLLVSSGVGHIGIVDDDIVSLNNLPRQTLYNVKDIDKPKVEVAKKHLRLMNPGVKIKAYKMRLNEENAKEIIKGYQLVIDCTDNFETKFLINDICVLLKKPFITGGVDDYKGQVMTYIPKISKDFKSLFSELPINIEEKYKVDDEGIYPVIVGIIGNIISSECLKYLTGIGEVLINKLLVVDLLENRFEIFKIE